MRVRSVLDRLKKTFIGDLIERFLEVNALERSLALGSKLFTTVVPLSILLSALLGRRNILSTRLIEQFGLTGQGANAMRTLFDVPSAQVWSAFSLIGVLVLGYSLLSFVRALQHVYDDAWHLPRLRSRGIAWGSVWIVAFAAYFSLSTPLSQMLTQGGFRVSGTIVALVVGTVLWLITPFILLGRRVRLRVLVPGGVANAILLVAFNAYSNIYLPHSVTVNVRRYGLIGVTFTLLSWLFVFSLILVVGACCGAVLAERRSDWADPRREAEAEALQSGGGPQGSADVGITAPSPRRFFPAPQERQQSEDEGYSNRDQGGRPDRQVEALGADDVENRRE